MATIANLTLMAAQAMKNGDDPSASTGRCKLRNHQELASQLRKWLGRPLVARMTDTADVNDVSRWARGTADPEPQRVAKMRLAAETFGMLTEVFGSEESARDWFTGANRFLDDQMPIDVIRAGDAQSIVAQCGRSRAYEYGIVERWDRKGLPRYHCRPGRRAQGTADTGGIR